jgi:CRISPR-associated protein Cmr6
MILSRRDRLQRIDVGMASHAGLWLDKYMKDQLRKGESPGRHEPPGLRLVKEVAGIPSPAVYGQFFRLWQNELHRLEIQTREATVQGRMVVGLGDETVLETAIALHHTYGVPYIPGSALKGFMASYARQRLESSHWGAATLAYRVVFGTPDEAGFITFFDALYVPDSGYNGSPLHVDVITVHHPEYYQQGDAAPADWDSPTPIPFLTATGRYLIALGGPEPWVSVAFDILGLALAEMGIGAKTSSGYGRMAMEATKDAVPVRNISQPQVQLDGPVDPDQATVNAFLQQVNALSTSQVAPQIPQLVDRWRKLDIDEVHKRRLAEALLKRVREAGREKASSEKAWYKELENYLREP